MSKKVLCSILFITALVFAMVLGYYIATEKKSQVPSTNQAREKTIDPDPSIISEPVEYDRGDRGYDPQSKKLSDIEILAPSSTQELLRDIELALSGQQEEVNISFENLPYDSMDDLCNHWGYMYDTDAGYGGKSYYSNYDSERDPQYEGTFIGEGPDGTEWYMNYDAETDELIPIAPVAGTYDERTDSDGYFYIFSMQKNRDYWDHQKQSHSAARSVAPQCKRGSEVETMNAIVDYMQNNVEYAYDVVDGVYNGGRSTQDYWEAFDAYGALVQHHAVCEGMAYATGMIARYCGIPCVIVFTEQHAWNAFKTSDGNVYMIDPTDGKYAYEACDWPSNKFCTEQNVRDWLDLKEEMIGGSGMSSGNALGGSTGRKMSRQYPDDYEESNDDSNDHETSRDYDNNDESSYSDNEEYHNNTDISYQEDNVSRSDASRDTNVSGTGSQRGPASNLQSGMYDNAPYTVTNGASSITAGKGKIDVAFIDRQGNLTYTVKIRSALQSLNWTTYTSTNPDMTIRGLSRGRYEVAVMANTYHSDGCSDNGFTYPIVVSVQ